MRALARILLCSYVLWELTAGGAWEAVAGFSDRVDCEAARWWRAKQRMYQGVQVVTLACVSMPETRVPKSEGH